MRKVFLFCLLCMMQIAYAQKYEPKWVGQVVALSIETDTTAKAAEKATVQVKTKQSLGRILVGIGNVREKVYIKGSSSPVQLDPSKPVTLIVKCNDNNTDPHSIIQIVEFEKGKNERRTELAMQNWLGNTSEGNMKLVPFEADIYGKSSYILTLQPRNGEFGVRIVNPNNVDEKVLIFNCFGTASFGKPVSVPEPVNTAATKDETSYDYKGILYPVYKKSTGERYIIIGKDEMMYLPEE